MRRSVRDFQKCFERDCTHDSKGAKFCDYRHWCRHRSFSVGHLIHCSNAASAIFGEMSKLATNETLSIGLVGVLPEYFTLCGLLALSFPFSFVIRLDCAKIHVSLAVILH